MVQRSAQRHRAGTGSLSAHGYPHRLKISQKYRRVEGHPDQQVQQAYRPASALVSGAHTQWDLKSTALTWQRECSGYFHQGASKEAFHCLQRWPASW